MPSDPLHPLTFELTARHPQPRSRILSGWNRLLNAPRFPPTNWIGETPLVASRALIDLIDQRIAALLGWLGPDLERRDDPSWPLAPAADVLCADLAVVEAPETERGWDLRWVEFQTFASALATCYTLHRASAELWPELGELAFWGKLPRETDWLEATRRWMAPVPGTILLENDAWSQPTRPDLEAVRHWFGLTVVDPGSLRTRSRRLEHRDESGNWRDAPHVANRLILHEVAQRAALEEILSSVSPGWNSHPIWYYRVNKSLMPDIPLPPAERCVRGDRWRDLGRAAEDLVAKQCHSHSGRDVRLKLAASALDALPHPRDWIVQPRFSPMPLLKARDGAGLYAELRCVIALAGKGRPPWLAARLARISRGPMASVSTWSGAPGEGVVPVYAPPEAW